MPTIQPGLTGEQATNVTLELTARHLGSGGIDVYATPSMVALMEGAAVAAIDPMLPDGQASVGVRLEIEHLAATPLGQAVRARAEVTEVDGRKVTFKVEAWDEREQIGKGTHIRFIIDSDRFLERVRQKEQGSSKS